ncbi:MAG: trypsin-like peptidase domain-containing protein [Clostridia bacterium]|nr:trypsin-like peptidase domain-containing protein [Clostridia bacterium]
MTDEQNNSENQSNYQTYGSDNGMGDGEYHYSYSVEYGPNFGYDSRTKKKNSRGLFILLGVSFIVLLVVLAAYFGVQIGKSTVINRPNVQKELISGATGAMEVVETFKTPNGEPIAAEEGTAAYVAKLNAQSVVEISTETKTTGGITSHYVLSGAGSGVVIGKGKKSGKSYIITNNHVVEGCDRITVTTDDGKTFLAELIGADWLSDIAVLRVDAGDLRSAVAGNSDALLPGEDIVTIGNPLGSLGGSVSKGIISGLSRTITVEHVPMTLLQIDAAINPGNSGGGLFNMKGELVGIVNSKSAGENIDGIGFAIPITTAMESVQDIISYGYSRNCPDLGLTFYGQYNTALVVSGSAYPDEVSDYLSTGDLLTQIGDTEVSTVEELRGALAGYAVGDTVDVTFYRSTGGNFWFRGGQYYTVSMTVHIYAAGMKDNTEEIVPAES